jgi:hypothetical protein
MDKKLIKSIISITKTRSEICWKYSRAYKTMSEDRILYAGKARAYDEMTEFLEALGQ